MPDYNSHMWPTEDFPLFDENDEDDGEFGMQDVENIGDNQLEKDHTSGDSVEHPNKGIKVEEEKRNPARNVQDEESDSEDEKIKLKPKERLIYWANQQWAVFSGIDGQQIEIKQILHSGQTLDDKAICERKQVIEELLSRVPRINKRFYGVLHEDLGKIQKPFRKHETAFQQALRATFDRSKQVQELLGCGPFKNEIDEKMVDYPARYYRFLEEWRKMLSIDPTKIRSSEIEENSDE